MGVQTRIERSVTPRRLARPSAVRGRSPAGIEAPERGEVHVSGLGGLDVTSDPNRVPTTTVGCPARPTAGPAGTPAPRWAGGCRRAPDLTRRGARCPSLGGTL